MSTCLKCVYNDESENEYVLDGKLSQHILEGLGICGIYEQHVQLVVNNTQNVFHIILEDGETIILSNNFVQKFVNDLYQFCVRDESKSITYQK
jgi:hypothetical protein